MNLASDTTSKPGSSGWQSALKASTGSQYLGDRPLVNGLVRHFIADICDRYAAVCDGRSTPWEASQADKDECVRMAGVFCGKDTAYTPMGGWNAGGGLGRYMAKLLEELVVPDELAEPQQALTQAFALFAHLVYQVLMRQQDDAEQRQNEMQALADEMTKALLGFETELFEQ
jgi:hypothetical protein